MHTTRNAEIVPRGRIARSATALVITGLAVVTALFAGTSQSRSATTGAIRSSNVVVVPGFSPATYPPYYGIPSFPTKSSELSAYHFSQLRADQVTTAALQPYDTLILYGQRWNSLSASAQQTIDTFAQTHKVLIWDADDTGSQSYASFIHPFSTTASGENGHKNDSVVSYPGGDDFLASDNPSSPYYLDPNQLVTDRNMINDMSAMPVGTAGWTPGLGAANANIPNGGWPLAWAYGDVGNHTGLVVYSGIDADAFTDNLNPNYSIIELELELKAPFSEAPASGCAPNCSQPPPPPPPSGGGGGGGRTYASCTLAPPAPRHWVRGNLWITLKTSVAGTLTGKILDRRGRSLASAPEQTEGVLRLLVRTRRLPSNRTSRLRAVVFFNGQSACTKTFRLKVDNIRPRLLRFRAIRTAYANVIELRVSESSVIRVHARGLRARSAHARARRTLFIHLPRRVHNATVVVRDRAGNSIVRRARWR